VIPYGTSVPVAVWRLRSANCYIRVTLLYFTVLYTVGQKKRVNLFFACNVVKNHRILMPFVLSG